MKYFIIIFSLFSSLAAWGKADFTMSSIYRSSPVVGFVKSELGNGFKLWGQGAWTGSLRPYVEAQASIGYSAYGLGLDFNFWRFLGFKASYLKSENSDSYVSFNCELYRCNDEYQQFLYQAHTGFRLGPLFSKLKWSQSNIEPQENDKDFIIPQYGLGLSSQGESIEVWDALVGVELIRGLSLFYNFNRASGLSGNSTQKVIGMRNVLAGHWSLVLGIGEFESPLAETDLMGLFGLTWQPLRGYNN